MERSWGCLWGWLDFAYRRVSPLGGDTLEELCITLDACRYAFPFFSVYPAFV